MVKEYNKIQNPEKCNILNGQHPIQNEQASKKQENMSFNREKNQAPELTDSDKREDRISKTEH